MTSSSPPPQHDGFLHWSQMTPISNVSSHDEDTTITGNGNRRSSPASASSLSSSSSPATSKAARNDGRPSKSFTDVMNSYPIDELFDDLELSMSKQGSEIDSMKSKLRDIEASLQKYGRHSHDDADPNANGQNSKTAYPLKVVKESSSSPSTKTASSVSTTAASSTASTSPFSNVLLSLTSSSLSSSSSSSSSESSSKKMNVQQPSQKRQSKRNGKREMTIIKVDNDRDDKPSSFIVRILPLDDCSGDHNINTKMDGHGMLQSNKKTVFTDRTIPDRMIEIPSSSDVDNSMTPTKDGRLQEKPLRWTPPSTKSNPRTKNALLPPPPPSRYFRGDKKLRQGQDRQLQDQSFQSTIVHQESESSPPSSPTSPPVPRRTTRDGDVLSLEEGMDGYEGEGQEVEVCYNSSSDPPAAGYSPSTSSSSVRIIPHVTFGTDDFVVPTTTFPSSKDDGKSSNRSHTVDESSSGGSESEQRRFWSVGHHDDQIYGADEADIRGQNDDDDDDNDCLSDLGESRVTSKTWAFRSRPAKMTLVCVGIVMVLLIGLVVGQSLVRRRNTSSPNSASTTATTIDGNSTVTSTSNPTMSDDENATSTSATSNSSNVVLKYDYRANSDYLVGTYYYPWHGNNFHNGDGYMRKELEPAHQPLLGEYNDSEPKVIGKHMEWFRQSNIGLLVASWWGPGRVEDLNTKDVIMEHEDIGNLKIALHYETTGRLIGDGKEMSTAATDIEYMCENYFNHTNYYKINGRPVLFIYVARKLEELGTLEQALLTMRSAAGKCGHNIYLIGDQVFASAPTVNPDAPHVPFWYFDAVTNYDVYGSSGRPQGYVGRDGVDRYYDQQARWRLQALAENCEYIPAVSPGYNDRAVRMVSNNPAMSRSLTASSQEGSLFHYQLKRAKTLVNDRVDKMILVNSFNEWHEDTQIEPVLGMDTTTPDMYTQGLEYVGYGELYLDILGAATSTNQSRHTEFDYLLDEN